MASRRLTFVAALLGLGVLVAAGGRGRTQQEAAPPDADQQEGVEVLARGPIHEGYAEPIDYRPQPTKVVPKQPPDPIEEVPPDQRPAGENVVWIPGYWAWDDDRSDFIWVSGIWRITPPGRNWVPGYWAQAEGGSQWSPGFWQAEQQQEVQYFPQPPEPLESGPSMPAPNAESTFVPGNWVWRDTRFAWRPGYFVDYRPGWCWIPAHYCWTPAGYTFVDGYWDFELGRRGLMFAPVHFTRPLWTTASWVFRPNYCVYDQFVLGSLFVRPGYYHYYFGDYFETAYTRRGFVPWFDYRLGRVGYDPLFSYYRWDHRDDRRWLTDLRGLYRARFNGEAPRPARTFVQQNTVVKNITNINNINVTSVNNLVGVAPLTHVNHNWVNLQPVPRSQLTEQRNWATQLRQVARQRTQLESRLVTRGSAPLTTRTPQAIRFDMPRAAAAANAERFQPPTAPHTTVRTPAERGRTPAAGERTYGREPRTPQELTPPRGREPGSLPREEIPRTEPRPAERGRDRALPPENRVAPRQEPRPPERRPGTLAPENRATPRPEPRPQPGRDPRELPPRREPSVTPRPEPGRPPAESRPQPGRDPRELPPRREPNLTPRPEPGRPPTEPRPRPEPPPRSEPRPPTAARSEPPAHFALPPRGGRTEPEPRPQPAPRAEPRPEPRPAQPAPRPPQPPPRAEQPRPNPPPPAPNRPPQPPPRAEQPRPNPPAPNRPPQPPPRAEQPRPNPPPPAPNRPPKPPGERNP